jgi:hypothetical protein
VDIEENDLSSFQNNIGETEAYVALQAIKKFFHKRVSGVLKE